MENKSKITWNNTDLEEHAIIDKVTFLESIQNRDSLSESRDIFIEQERKITL